MPKWRKTDILRDMKWVNGALWCYPVDAQIPDDAQINDELYSFWNVFNQGTNL